MPDSHYPNPDEVKLMTPYQLDWKYVQSEAGMLITVYSIPEFWTASREQTVGRWGLRETFFVFEKPRLVCQTLKDGWFKMWWCIPIIGATIEVLGYIMFSEQDFRETIRFVEITDDARE